MNEINHYVVNFNIKTDQLNSVCTHGGGVALSEHADSHMKKTPRTRKR